ncbi:hypothetical protein TGARI_213960 [Toxoplasma gondii ARI]|uniref:Uncharacterized protein n=2 Tax=Toxoplasma gondii TaxID=5811 RepID=A0A2G8XYN6_TOXGO|nr:hypothetical protein TGARI_213960 [Toxoplasma gondii ARI]PIM00126.1 hypothetical protein TGCOUG_213960 [Toxoplasma gondii COUG]
MRGDMDRTMYWFKNLAPVSLALGCFARLQRRFRELRVAQLGTSSLLHVQKKSATHAAALVAFARRYAEMLDGLASEKNSAVQPSARALGTSNAGNDQQRASNAGNYEAPVYPKA